ncbi:4-amino-4-deoxy-L-arabinose transferase-like glycosyltransferase [Streptomyces sp. 3330]|uniref:potassium channel family protein n=1 Tax=Streptomyces sp. 3330 TaxID=2817755 RepID=UPI002857D735|nr:potassium channel family protein [Streptomyces sp. 3330]MDR6980711.1 4-amino-4-deoxy-L-arabinose transferase-like glycosyltransferase [Streptomyces sp. 3330]
MTDDLPRPGRRAALWAVARSLLVSSGLVLAYYLLPMDAPLNGGTVAGLVLGLLAVTALFLWQVRTIVRSPNPELRAVESLAAVLPLFVLVFATSYFLLERATPGSFTEPLSRTDALYFTLTVVSTVGFGDITGRTETARVMTMIQIVGGILLVGIAARVVVRAVEAGRHRQDPKSR